MLIVFALLVLGIMVGAVAHIPVTASAIAGTGIAAWLITFWVRERTSGRYEGDA